MAMLITVDQAKAQVRGGDEIDDDEMEELVEEASAMILNYLKSSSPYVPETDSSGDPVLDSSDEPVYTEEIRPEVKRAVKTLVAMLWRHRDENPNGIFEGDTLPAPVRFILTPLRDPALA